MNIILDLQRPDGTVSTHGPTTLFGFEECCPGYSDFLYNFCLCVYQFEGDIGAVRKYYPALKKTALFFENMTRDDLLYHMGYGDWCHPLAPQGGDGYPQSFDPTMVESVLLVSILNNTAYFASLLELPSDQKHFSELAAAMAARIHKTFYDSATGLYDHGMRASTAMALYFGIVPENERKRTAAALAEQIRADRHRVISGIMGAKYVPRALAENGYAADAFEMLVQSEYPGWGNLIARGATTLWENWKGTFSRNHIMFGDVSAWMYRYPAGMSPAAPGFRRIRLQPCLVPQLTEVEAEHRTPLGMLRSAWKRENGFVNCRFEIPSGAEADIFLPGEERHSAVGKVEIRIPDPEV